MAQTAGAQPPRLVLDYLRLAEPYLARHGSPTPRLDAEVLLAHVLGTSRLELYTRLDQPLTRAEVDAYRQAIQRRANREPVAYIVGYKEFYGLRFMVGPGVLVPRPETEYLVELALRALAGVGAPSDAASPRDAEPEAAAPAADGVGAAGRAEGGRLRFVDVGTGSGALAVTLAVRRADLRGVGCDIAAEALAYARANARHHGVSDRLTWVQGDALSWAAERSFDMVLSNPPYVPTHQLDGLAPEIRRYEPRQALDGGPDGLSVARRVAEQAARVLRPGGLLIMELGTPDQARALAAVLRYRRAYERVAAVQDPVSRVPALVASTPGGEPIPWPVAPSEELGPR